jgi:hypothetical protein
MIFVMEYRKPLKDGLEEVIAESVGLNSMGGNLK